MASVGRSERKPSATGRDSGSRSAAACRKSDTRYTAHVLLQPHGVAQTGDAEIQSTTFFAVKEIIVAYTILLTLLKAALLGSDVQDALKAIRSGDLVQLVQTASFAISLAAMQWWTGRTSVRSCWDGRERRSATADRRAAQAGGRRATDRRNVART